LLYHEYAETPGSPTDEDGADDDSGTADDELDDAIDAAFCDAVRARATADRYRLDLEPRPATAAADETTGGDDGMREVDVNLEAGDTCEQLVQLVLDSENWDIPRDIMNSVLELDHEDSGRLAASLIARAAGYLVSFKDAGLTREELDAAMSRVGDEQGAEY